MSEWKEYRLEQITEPVKETVHPVDVPGIPYIGLEHIQQETLRLEGTGTSMDVSSNKFRFRSSDVLFGKLRPYFRKVVQAKFDGICSTDIWVFKAKSVMSQDFLFYFLANWDFVNLANSGEGGTRMPRADWNYLKNTVWELPGKEEQLRIAATLSSLDNKIDLLHRQNATLEALGVTLFKHQISNADFLEADTLGNLFNVSIGRTPPRKEPQWFTFNPSDIKWISIKDMGNAGVYIDKTSEYLTKEAVVRFNVPIIPTNTVLLSFKLTLGRVAITTENMLSNEAIAHLKIKDGTKFYPEFVYLFLKAFNYSSLGSTSSIAEAINSQMIKQIEMPVPDDETLNSLKEQVMPLFKKMKSNSKQLKTLTQLRDTLLPKLMSGEVRIESVQEEMADV